MASIENVRESLNGYRLTFECVNTPIPFVNGLRRILLAEIPTVVIRDVVIRENTSQMIHEMLKHRVEMLPVQVQASEGDVIRDTKLTVRFLPSPETREVTSDDFVAVGPRAQVILRDRDLKTPLTFLTLNPNEALHIECGLGLAMTGASQVCVSTFRNHIDERRAKLDRDSFILSRSDEDVRIFDNHLIQRSYTRDPVTERPIHFDFTVESIGVYSARELVRIAVELLKKKVTEFVKLPISKDETGAYLVETTTEGHTLGALAQSILYDSPGLVEFVSYRIDHPLTAKLILQFRTKSKPEAVLERFQVEALALCETVLRGV
jgi:DNA-directed RNA polymerase subunit L